MLNLNNALPSRQHFEVTLRRKTTCNAEQNARARIEHVYAADSAEAKKVAEAMPQNAAFKAYSAREVR